MKGMSPDQKVQIRIRIQDLIKETQLENCRAKVREAVSEAITLGLGDMEIIAIAHQVVAQSKRAKTRKNRKA